MAFQYNEIGLGRKKPQTNAGRLIIDCVSCSHLLLIDQIIARR